MHKNLPGFVPEVRSFKAGKGTFIITDRSTIRTDSPEGVKKAELLADYLRPATGFPLPVGVGVPQPGDIVLNVGDESSESFPSEKYRIEITEASCYLKAGTPEGAARGIQTLRQLLPEQILAESVQYVTWSMPVCVIDDEPALPWRGLHLDVSRHFFTREEVCRYIDILAFHRYNRFHFHLTDDQGWRLEIKKYPELTEKASLRRETLIGHNNDRPREYDGKSYSGYYTQEDIKDIVNYASRREIEIIPEIDMPGHVQAVLAVFPHLGCGFGKLETRCHWGISQHVLNAEEETLNFFKNILDEVAELFPGKYVHIGGDEVPPWQWSENRGIQNRIKELGLKDETELQSWFIETMGKHLQSRGKKYVSWDESLEGGVSTDAVIMGWRGWLEENPVVKAARKGHNVINTLNTHTYYDYYQSEDKEKEPLAISGCTTLEMVYSFDPVPPELNSREKKLVLGGQGQLWTEYIKESSYLYYMAYPRACALSEVLWLEGSEKNWKAFKERMNHHKKRLDILRVSYKPF